MAAEEFEIMIEIVCEDLPGSNYRGHGPLHLGIQHDEKAVEATPADRDRIMFRPVLRVRKHADGSANFLGPFAQGPRSERFIYLNWLVVRNKIPVEQVGRIKLQLNHIEYKDAQKAAERKQPIKVTLRLRNDKGEPIFASVRPNNAKWTL